MAKNNLNRKAAIFSALGDEVRLDLIQKLVATNDLSITELAEGHSISRQAITKHLHVLENAGLVTCEKEGRESRYTLDTTPLSDAMSLLETVERKWDQRLARLKLYTENTD